MEGACLLGQSPKRGWRLRLKALEQEYMFRFASGAESRI
jgi:hypothetical protein